MTSAPIKASVLSAVDHQPEERRNLVSTSDMTQKSQGLAIASRADTTVVAAAPPPPPPPYGSLEYWEDRYRQTTRAIRRKRRIVEDTSASTNEGETSKAKGNNDLDEKDDPEHESLAYHAWYYTYDDLRPLLLPLIMGGLPPFPRVVDTDLLLDGDALASASAAAAAADDDDNDIINSNNNNNVQDDAAVVPVHTPNDEAGANKDNDEIEDDETEDDEEGGIDRPGLARTGPISILEVGCGDVPLGAGLALDLLDLESKTGASAINIVHRIRCVDYSPTVIDWMQQHYRRGHDPSSLLSTSLLPSSSSPTVSSPAMKKAKIQPNPTGSVNVQHIPLEFEVVDARDMPYADESWDMILEKGTLDALLSDPALGVKHSIEALSECARVLRMGGVILLVSHLNAHTPYGMNWLRDVVFPALQMGAAGESHISWLIEIHGKAPPAMTGEAGDGSEDDRADVMAEDSIRVVDDDDEDDDDEDEEDEEEHRRRSHMTPWIKAGPGVYIIHKKEKSEASGIACSRVPVSYSSSHDGTNQEGEGKGDADTVGEVGLETIDTTTATSLSPSPSTMIQLEFYTY